MELSNIFLGNTPSEQRKFMLECLTYLKGKGIKKIIIPCCGQFALVKCAIEAGYEKKNIYASDISLFSNLLGYYYTDRTIKELGYSINDEVLAEKLEKLNEVQQVAFILLLIKINQLRNDIHYERNYRNEIYQNFGYYQAQLEDKLIQSYDIYKGIHYMINDLREYIISGMEYKKDELVIINPPAFKKGYEKMFNYHKDIKYDPGIEEFDFNSEYRFLYEQSKKAKAPFLWYRYKETSGFNKDEVVFAKEYSVDRYDYWLMTKPKLLKGFNCNKELIRKKPSDNINAIYKIFPADEKLSPDYKTKFLITDENTALYYRELFAHKLGVTKAETYYIIFVNNLLIGSCGFHGAELRRMQSTNIFEVFCFNISSELYPNLNRLMMMFLTCREFKEELMTSMFKTNRIFELDGLKTTCLSKYRKVKLNNNLLTIRTREKLKNGMYRIVYETEFYDRTYKDCIESYLKELK